MMNCKKGNKLREYYNDYINNVLEQEKIISQKLIEFYEIKFNEYQNMRNKYSKKNDVMQCYLINMQIIELYISKCQQFQLLFEEYQKYIQLLLIQSKEIEIKLVKQINNKQKSIENVLFKFLGSNIKMQPQSQSQLQLQLQSQSQSQKVENNLSVSHLAPTIGTTATVPLSLVTKLDGTNQTSQASAPTINFHATTNVLNVFDVSSLAKGIGNGNPCQFLSFSNAAPTITSIPSAVGSVPLLASVASSFTPVKDAKTIGAGQTVRGIGNQKIESIQDQLSQAQAPGQAQQQIEAQIQGCNNLQIPYTFSNKKLVDIDTNNNGNSIHYGTNSQSIANLPWLNGLNLIGNLNNERYNRPIPLTTVAFISPGVDIRNIPNTSSISTLPSMTSDMGSNVHISGISGIGSGINSNSRSQSTTGPSISLSRLQNLSSMSDLDLCTSSTNNFTFVQDSGQNNRKNESSNGTKHGFQFKLMGDNYKVNGSCRQPLSQPLSQLQIHSATLEKGQTSHVSQIHQATPTTQVMHAIQGMGATQVPEARQAQATQGKKGSVADGTNGEYKPLNVQRLKIEFNCKQINITNKEIENNIVNINKHLQFGKRRNNLNKNEKLQSDKPFACNQCEKRFKVRKNLRAHVKIHNGNGFKCNHCGKLFARKSNLQEHIRIQLRTRVKS